MDPIVFVATTALVISEVLPLIDCTTTNGIVHGVITFICKLVDVFKINEPYRAR
jgi:hypothetical protein